MKKRLLVILLLSALLTGCTSPFANITPAPMYTPAPAATEKSKRTPEPTDTPFPTPTPLPSAPPDYLASVGVVNTNALNVRQKASGSAKVLHTLDKGQLVQILREENGWYLICDFSYGIGYVKNDYVTGVTEPTAMQSRLGGETLYCMDHGTEKLWAVRKKTADGVATNLYLTDQYGLITAPVKAEYSVGDCQTSRGGEQNGAWYADFRFEDLNGDGVNDLILLVMIEGYTPEDSFEKIAGLLISDHEDAFYQAEAFLNINGVYSKVLTEGSLNKMRNPFLTEERHQRLSENLRALAEDENRVIHWEMK